MIDLASVGQYALLVAVVWISLISTIFGFFILKGLYNISPLHPLSKYPGPLAFRFTRLCASYHHASGTLYQRIAAIHEQYGPTVRLAPDELSFTNPEAWAQIYNSRPQLAKSKFHFGGGNGNGNSEAERQFPVSMIMAPDAEHMRLRRLANPAFLNSGVFEVEDVLQHYVDLLCKQLRVASSERAPGDEKSSRPTPQSMVEWYLWALNDVIGQLALDQEFECLEKRRMHPWPSFLLGVLKQSAVINQFARFGFTLKFLAPIMPKSVRAKFENFIGTAREAIERRLKRAEEEEAADAAGVISDKKRRQDIIGLMMREMKGGERLTKPEIASNSVLIVGGGAETTSTCLSATTYHLCKTPDVLRKLTKEIRTAFKSSEEITLRATAELPYLKACIDESLRIFPVASYITPRMTPEGGHVVDGELIPEGTYVSMGQWFMGRSDRVFDEPKTFRPERWLEGTNHVQAASGFDAEAILRPFSLGPRNCIGKLLALAEVRLVIAKLLWHFDLELAGPQESWVDDARFYVLWELQPLYVRLTPVDRAA